jgi:Uma2 family endonuclease
MDTILDRTWSAESFLAWEDQREGKHEFDGRQVIPMTGGSVAHQDIVFNLRVLLARLLAGSALRAVQEMRLRIGQKIRYPDVVVCHRAIDQVQRTLHDAVVIFEVLSDDTTATDRVEKLADYANVPSSQYYIMLEQSSRAAVVCKRSTGEAWTTTAVTEGAILLGELNLVLPLDGIYQGLPFSQNQPAERLTL